MGDQANVTELKLCQFSREVGIECRARANHQWGPLYLCCRHFDELVTAMFEIRDLAAERQHKDFVRIYEERTHKSSQAEGSACGEAKGPREGRVHGEDE